MRISQNHRKALVAKQFLDCADADAGHSQSERERVAEVVRVEVLDLRLVDGILKLMASALQPAATEASKYCCRLSTPTASSGP
jgi:hypothetical protein